MGKLGKSESPAWTVSWAGICHLSVAAAQDTRDPHLPEPRPRPKGAYGAFWAILPPFPHLCPYPEQ